MILKKRNFHSSFFILAGDIIAVIGIKGIRYFSNGVPFNFVKKIPLKAPTLISHRCSKASGKFVSKPFSVSIFIKAENGSILKLVYTPNSAKTQLS